MAINFSKIKNNASFFLVCCILTAGSVYAEDCTIQNDTKATKTIENTTVTIDCITKTQSLFELKRNEKKYTEALDLVNKLIDLNAQLYGAESVQCANAYILKATLDIDFYVFDSVKETIDTAAAIVEKHPEDTVLRTSLYNLIYHYHFSLFHPYANIEYLSRVNPNYLDTDTKLLDIYNKFGPSYMMMKESKKADEYYTMYNELSEKLYGETSLNTLMYYQNKLFLSRDTFDYANINNYYQKAEEIRLALCPNEIWQESRNLMSIVNYYTDILDVEKAEKALEAFALKTKDTTDITIKRNIYGAYFSLYKDVNEYDKAYEYLQKLEEVHSAYPENSINRTSYYKNQIEFYNDIQESEKAIEAANKALATMEKSRDVASGYYGGFLRKLAESLAYTGKTEASIKAINESIETYRKAFPEDAYVMHEVYKTAAEVHQRAGDNKTALAYYKKALKIAKHYVGETQVATADVYTSLAFLHSSMSKKRAALKYANKAIEIYTNIYGDDNVRVYEKMLEKYYICSQLSLTDKANDILAKIKEADSAKTIKGHKKMLYHNLYRELTFDNMRKNDFETALQYAEKAADSACYEKQKAESTKMLEEFKKNLDN